MKVIFFVVANPAKEPGRLSTAYRLASAAAEAQLEAEVRLADDAVLAADPVFLATVPTAADLRSVIDRSSDERFQISVCPRSIERHGINDWQVAAIGAGTRPLSDILVEVAEGRSVLVHLG